jgi:hypothetical protein
MRHQTARPITTGTLRGARDTGLSGSSNVVEALARLWSVIAEGQAAYIASMFRPHHSLGLAQLFGRAELHEFAV